MNIQELQARAHATAVAKGWHESTLRDENGKPTVTQFLAWLFLACCELSEANREKAHHYTHDGKPEGKAVELADILIRLLDTADACGYTPVNIAPGDTESGDILDAIADIGELARNVGVNGSGVRRALYEAIALVRYRAMCIGYGDRNFEAVILEKMDFNDTRERRHGGKLA